METEPGIGPYEPEPAPIVVPPARPNSYESGHRSKYEHREEHTAPVGGYTEYRRRYEHQRTQSRIVPGGPEMVERF